MLDNPDAHPVEALHDFTNNANLWPPIVGLPAASTPPYEQTAMTFSHEAEGTSFPSYLMLRCDADAECRIQNQPLVCAVLNLARELRCGRVQKGCSEEPLLTCATGLAYVKGVQNGRCRSEAGFVMHRMAANCGHFAPLGSPQGGLCVRPLLISLASAI